MFLNKIFPTTSSSYLFHKLGRRTGQLDLQPFSFRQTRDAISYGLEDAIRSYSGTGGTPMYLTLFDYDESLAEDIRSQILVGLAPDDDRLLLAECMWTSDHVGHVLVEDRQSKAERVRWGPGTREERFALFSKSGFIDGLEDDLDDTWSLFTLEDLEMLF